MIKKNYVNKIWMWIQKYMTTKDRLHIKSEEIVWQIESDLKVRSWNKSLIQGILKRDEYIEVRSWEVKHISDKIPPMVQDFKGKKKRACLQLIRIRQRQWSRCLIRVQQLGHKFNDRQRLNEGSGGHICTHDYKIHSN